MRNRKYFVDAEIDACLVELERCVRSLLERYPSSTVLGALMGAIETCAQELLRRGDLSKPQLIASLDQLKREALAETSDIVRSARHDLN